MATDIIARGMAANAKKSVTELGNKVESEKWIGTKAEWEAVDKSTIKDGTIVYITDDKTVILYDKAEMEKIAAQVATDRKAAETAAQTAQSIADSLPDDYVTAVGKIAENTAEIANVKLTDKELKRRVDALFDMGQGVTHRFETDTDTAYTKTVPTGGKLMSVKSVGGRSIVFNQSFQPRKGANNGVTVTADSDGTITINGTTTASYINFRDVTPEQNKIGKYAFKLLILNNPDNIEMGFSFLNRSKLTPKITRGSSAMIYNQTQSEIALGKATGISGFAVGTVFNDVKIKIQIFNLTAMFGSGNEPSTVEEFEKIFPADYYPYNAGEIVSAGTEEIVEQGKNLWDEVWGIGSINASSGNDEGSKETIYSKSYTPIIPNSTYIFVYAGSVKFENVKTRFYDRSKKYIGFNDNDGRTVCPNKTFRTPLNAFYVRFTLPPAYGNVYKNDIALIAGSSGTYAPYHSNVYPIPEAIRNLPGYGVDGNIVDYENKTYTQVNSVSGTEIVPLETPIVTDISSLIPDDFLRNIEVEAGGSITFKGGNDDYRIPVPSEEEYIVKLSEVGGSV